MNTAARKAAQEVRILILDVDGVLTDGGLAYDASATISKRFYVKDGFGIKMAQKAGLDFAVISGLDHQGVAARVRELGITEYYAGKLKKLEYIKKMLAARDLAPSQAAYLGDDYVDALPMKLVGLPMAVADAMPRIRELALWVSERPGGRGAVREAIEFILEARGLLDERLKEWFG